MDIAIFRTIFFKLLVFFTFTFITLHFTCSRLRKIPKEHKEDYDLYGQLVVVQDKTKVLLF